MEILIKEVFERKMQDGSIEAIINKKIEERQRILNNFQNEITDQDYSSLDTSKQQKNQSDSKHQ